MGHRTLTYKQLLKMKDYLPFYVYDCEKIKEQILKLQKYLPSNAKIYYSVKANPNIAILRIMKNFGLGAEIVSSGEFRAVQKAGFKSSEILFAGSIKSNEDFLSAIKNSISLVSLESRSEAERAHDIVKNLNKKMDILLRLSLVDSERNKSFRAGRVGWFGIPRKEAEYLFENFPNKFPCFNLRGVHIYEHSRLYDAEILINGIRRVFSFVKEMEKKNKISIEIINIGGGFGANAKEEFPVIDFSKKLEKIIAEYNFNDKKIILESGRYLINSAGSYVARIIETKRRHGINLLISEGGIINHLVRVWHNLDIENNFRKIWLLRKSKDDPDDYIIKFLPLRRNFFFRTIICGQLASMADTLGRGFVWRFSLPQPKTGDFIIIKGVGAYGLTQGFYFFGSRFSAAEFLLINGKLELIRDKGRSEDFLRHQIIPDLLK